MHNASAFATNLAAFHLELSKLDCLNHANADDVLS